MEIFLKVYLKGHINQVRSKNWFATIFRYKGKGDNKNSNLVGLCFGIKVLYLGGCVWKLVSFSSQCELTKPTADMSVEVFIFV